MPYAIPSELYTMLAQAQSQPDRWARDLNSASGAVSAIGDSIKGYQATQRQKKLDAFFDSAVPTQTLKRAIPGAPTDGSITYRDLGGLSGSGLASMLRAPDNTADPMTLSVIGSGGDPDKADKLYKMFTQQKDADGNPADLKLNQATLNAAKLLKPPKPSTPRGGSASPEVQTLKALQTNLQKTLSGDISETERKTASLNLAAVNKRLARLGGVDLSDVPPAPPAPPAAPVAAPAAPVKKSGLVQQLLDALSK